MSKIKSKNTKPELLVRRLIWHEGYRYRLHYKKLPGTPDLAFVSKKRVIFINGCFWHGHKCRSSNMPKTNTVFWRNKIEKNKKRDLSTKRKLTVLGWKYLTLWECELKKANLLDRIDIFLKG